MSIFKNTNICNKLTTKALPINLGLSSTYSMYGVPRRTDKLHYPKSITISFMQSKVGWAQSD
jgi:hypothetical protein